MSDEERKGIIEVCCEKRFRDLTPGQIVAALLEEGRYLGSERTFYRVLKQAGVLKHRSNSRVPRKQVRPPARVATGPNQVYSWDISYLRTDVKGVFLYLYMIMDVWSRRIVGWEIHDVEDSSLARSLFLRLKERFDLQGVFVHSDNGAPMKASTMLMTFYALGVIPSFSRPRVSDDNPYSESLFKTIKYSPGYPRYFKDISHAREWMAGFVDWYNEEHRHSGIGYVTPNQRHDGTDKALFEKRNRTLLAAFEKHPERWSAPVKQWTHQPVVYLNPTSDQREQTKRSA